MRQGSPAREEDLAERGAVRGEPLADPVHVADEEPAVDLGDLLDLVAHEDCEVDGLARDRVHVLQIGPGELDEGVIRPVGVRVTGDGRSGAHRSVIGSQDESVPFKARQKAGKRALRQTAGRLQVAEGGGFRRLEDGDEEGGCPVDGLRAHRRIGSGQVLVGARHLPTSDNVRR